MKSLLLFIFICISISCFSQEKMDTFFYKSKNTEGTVFFELSLNTNFIPLFYRFVSDSTPVSGVVIMHTKKGEPLRVSHVLNGFPFYDKIISPNLKIHRYLSLNNRDNLFIWKKKNKKLRITVYHTEVTDTGERRVIIKGKGYNEKGIKIIRSYFEKGTVVKKKEIINLYDFFKEIIPNYLNYSTEIKELLELTSD